MHMEPVGMKRCTKCREEKSLGMFAVLRKTPDGRQYWCRACAKAFNAIRYQKKRAEIGERTAQYRAANPDKVKQYKRAYYETHKAEYRAQLKAWRQAHPESANNWQRRRARLKGVLSDLTHEQWLDLLADYGYACHYCGSTSKLTQDHIVPLSKGGPHTKTNVVPACQPCNSRKGNRVAGETD